MHRPNIVMVVFDALSAQALNGMRADTPTLAKLHDESAVFVNAYTPASEGGPARASLFTGLDPFVHGVWTDGVVLPDHEKTFVERLAQGGYSTWLIGRRQLSGLSHWTTEPLRPYEYTQCEWAHGPLHRSRQSRYLQWLQETSPEAYSTVFPLQANPDDMVIPALQYKAMAELNDELSFNYWVGQRVGEMISSHSSGQPFLCVAGFVVGESMGAEPSRAIVGDGVIERSVHQADSAVKHIIECLHANGFGADTVVVVCAARGNVDNDQVTYPLSESQIKVPLFIRQPVLDTKAVEQPVSIIDIAPTMLDMAQLPLPPRLQGASLLNKPPRGWALSRQRSEYHGWHTALCIDQWKLVVSHGSSTAEGASNYRLFDLTADPEERNDLASAAEYANKLEDMIDKLIDARCAMEDRTEPRIAKF